MTPPVTPSKQATTSQHSTSTPDDVTRHAHVADVASDVLRMRKVKQKLDSVLVSGTVSLYISPFWGGVVRAVWVRALTWATVLCYASHNELINTSSFQYAGLPSNYLEEIVNQQCK